MKTTRRTKRTRLEQELVAHIRRAQDRKVPLAQYCQARGLNVQSAYNLRRRLRAMDDARRRVASAEGRKPTDPFISLRVAPTVVPAAAACRVQVKGWVIECASLPPPAWLAGLIRGDADAVS